MINKELKNIDQKTVSSFGDEWSRFDQRKLSHDEGNKIFEEYFAVFPWDKIDENSVGFDMGCGTGRWAKYILPKVKHLHCIDPSSAIEIAKKNLAEFINVSFLKNTVDDSGLDLNSQDFGYSLGVLHHIPDTRKAISSCVGLLKPKSPLLVYLYYSFDNRPLWFRLIWKISDIIRRVIFRFPPFLKHTVTDLIAVFVYFPLSVVSKLLYKLNINVEKIPLSFYKDHSFYTMRTDARDRFGTPLEQRFTKSEIKKMMEEAGLEKIKFSDHAPYWCAVGYKKESYI